MANYNSGIYEIKNTENGKRYIGSSKELETRILNHLWGLNKERHCNDHLQNAWDKYGEEAFEFNILLYCSEENLGMYEGKIIEGHGSYKRENGYNLTKEGERTEFTEEVKRKLSENHADFSGENNPMYGKELSERVIRKRNSPEHSGENNPMYGESHSKEAKKKMSEAHKGKTFSEEHRKKLSESLSGEDHPMYGKNRSEETKKKISETKKGESFTEEHKENLSEAHKGEDQHQVKLSMEEVKEIKKLLKNTNKTFREIAKEFNVSDATISNIKTGESWNYVKI
jgi:group I intron endonuclease